MPVSAMRADRESVRIVPSQHQVGVTVQHCTVATLGYPL